MLNDEFWFDFKAGPDMRIKEWEGCLYAVLLYAGMQSKAPY